MPRKAPGKPGYEEFVRIGFNEAAAVMPRKAPIDAVIATWLIRLQ